MTQKIIWYSDDDAENRLSEFRSVLDSLTTTIGTDFKTLSARLGISPSHFWALTSGQRALKASSIFLLVDALIQEDTVKHVEPTRFAALLFLGLTASLSIEGNRGLCTANERECVAWCKARTKEIRNQQLQENIK